MNRIILALIPPLSYVMIPFGLSYQFYNLIATTESRTVSLVSGVIMFVFYFTILSLKVKKLSNDHDFGITLKPHQKYIQLIVNSLMWNLNTIVSVLLLLTVFGVKDFFIIDKLVKE